MSRRHRIWWCALAAAGVCATATPNAHALIIVTPRAEQPNNSAALALREEVINVKLTDRVAEVDVQYAYFNSSTWVLEGTYLFPLPPEAAVDNFSLYVDGEEIRAELLDVNEARRTYEQIVRQVMDPALLEYADRQLLRARIFPINPNTEARIRLYYTHPLVADFGTTDFAFPFPMERREPNAKTSLNIELTTTSPVKAVTSPTHDVRVAIDSPNRATVTAPDDFRPGSNDFHLLCTYDTRELGAQFLAAQGESGERFFMAIIAPGEIDDDHVLPKDVVFCFDRSGSMQGAKIEQAREALRFCLNGLNREDRFGLLVFNDRVDALSTKLLPANRAEIRNAQEFTDRIRAEGGTFIDGALHEALRLFERSDRPRYLVFLTDGLPTVGSRDPATIIANAKERNRHDARIFTFGVGYDLNAGLLNDLAEAGRGQSSYVEPGEDVEIKVSNFFRKISRPVLADCRLEFEGDAKISDVYPAVLPDLYAGSEVVVLGRIDKPGTAKVRLIGTRGEACLNHTFDTKLDPKEGRYAFVPKLWAGRRIGHLLEDMRRNGETAEVKDEVVRLSKQYGIMTPYTAFLAAPEEVRIATRPPVGVGHSSMPDIAPSPQGSTSGTLPPQTVTHSRAAIQMDEATSRRDISSSRLKSSPNVETILSDQDARREATDGSTRSIPGRQFTMRDGHWTDWALIGNTTAPADTVHIKPFSESYFRLAANAELARILAVGDRIIFLWRNVVIRIDENGAETWNSAWDRLL